MTQTLLTIVLGYFMIWIALLALHVVSRTYYHMTEVLGYKTTDKLYVDNTLNYGMLVTSVLFVLGFSAMFYVYVPIAMFAVYRYFTVRKEIKGLESE